MNREELLTKEIKINIECINGTVEQKSAIHDCVDLLKWVVNNREWREAVLDFSRYGKKQYLQTNRTNEELLEAFIKGDERFRGDVDYELDIKVKFYRKRSKAVAYVNSNSIILNLNTKYFPRALPSFISTLVHEMSHMYGGTHSYRRSKDWPSTSPYFYGATAQKLVEIKLHGQPPETIYIPKPSLWIRFKRWLGIKG